MSTAITVNGIDYPPPLALASTGSASSIGLNNIGTAQVASPADHVHDFGASLQKKRVAASASTQWVFDTPFVNGVVPIITCVIESPAGGPVFGEPQIISIDNTQVTVQIKSQSSTLSVLGFGVLNLFSSGVPANTFLHLIARNPSV